MSLSGSREKMYDPDDKVKTQRKKTKHTCTEGSKGTDRIIEKRD